MRNVSGKSCRENQNTHFMFNNFFRNSCRIWDNLKKCRKGRQATYVNIIRRMCFACWIIKAIHTHTQTHAHRVRIFNTYFFSTATMVTRKFLVACLNQIHEFVSYIHTYIHTHTHMSHLCVTGGKCSLAPVLFSSSLQPSPKQIIID